MVAEAFTVIIPRPSEIKDTVSMRGGVHNRRGRGFSLHFLRARLTFPDPFSPWTLFAAPLAVSEMDQNPRRKQFLQELADGDPR
jgi:hypothetical protein